jgi:hypothetical protein
MVIEICKTFRLIRKYLTILWLDRCSFSYANMQIASAIS